MGRNRQLTKEQCTKIRERYERGDKVTDIAETYDVATLTVMRAVLIAGGEIPNGPTYDAMRARLNTRSGRPRTVTEYVTNEGYRKVIIDETDPLFVMGQLRGRPSHHGTRTVLEHRLVMARHLERPLLSHETVHHKDGDRLNNNLDNLELWAGRHGKGASESHCATCSCFPKHKVASK